MSKNFKCCQNKPFANFICIHCYGIFHPKCLDRLKNWSIIEGCKIFCSKECAEKGKNLNDRKEFEDKIGVLLKKLELEKSEVRRLEEINEYSEQNMSEMEKKFASNMQEQCGTISNLKKNVQDLKKKNTELQLKLETCRERIKELENLKDDLLQIKCNMLTSIETITKEKECCENELVQLKSKQCSFYDASKDSTQFDSTSSSRPDYGQKRFEKQSTILAYSKSATNSLQRSKRILILCDQFGKGLGESLNSMIKGVKIETIIKPYAYLENIINCVDVLCKDFTENDYVIIIGGFNNIVRGKYPSFKYISEQMKSCSNTNLLFFSIPFVNHDYTNDFVYRFNKNLKSYIFRMKKYELVKVSYVDINSSVHMKILHKNIIAKKVIELVIHGSSLVNNLIHISMNDSSRDFQADPNNITIK